ncbi:peroxidase 12-like protein, partial [Tanacetum coccineum]
MVNMVPHEAFACRCAEGDVVLRQSYKPESYGKLYYACPKSMPPKHFGCGFFLWKETRLRELMSSSGAPSTPSYSAGHSTPPSYNSGPSTPPSYSSGPSTPTNYSLRSSRNGECSNCKHLRGKISVLKATMEMHMHPEQHTVNSAALFHEGCDSSVLLNGSASGPGEQLAPPNLTLRPRAFTIIENIRSLVHAACNQTVSCSDITALAARDAVFLSGGPTYNVPLGRRDGVDFATRDETLANLPPFNATAANLTAAFALKGLDVTDLVALSGAHTIGRAECGSFERRMFPTQDPTMEQTFYSSLLATCPILNTTNTTMMDIRSPNVFDNRYYVNLMARQGLFTSDQDLFTDNTTSGIVEAFANNQTLFFENFVIAMIKMGQMNVTTGTQGEIRADCSI